MVIYRNRSYIQTLPSPAEEIKVARVLVSYCTVQVIDVNIRTVVWEEIKVARVLVMYRTSDRCQHQNSSTCNVLVPSFFGESVLVP